MRNAVCLYEIDSNGEEMWEMVDPDAGVCIEYFASKDAARRYAKARDIKITEWIEEDYLKVDAHQERTNKQ